MDTERNPPPLRVKPTSAQIHLSAETSKKFKALEVIHSSVSEAITTKIMNCETAEEPGTSGVKSSKETKGQGRSDVKLVDGVSNFRNDRK